MAKSENQKLKLLYILEMLSELTDEDHVLSTKAIIDRLAEKNIKAERKSIYADMQSLVDFGYDVLYKSGRTDGGYYLATRDFELAELKLLVDAVQASRFITPKKSRELIEKLEKLTSRHQAGQLKRQVFVTGRVKADNEKIYYTIDAVYNAIRENVKLSFTYMEWTLDKKLSPRKKGEKYLVSPWSLVWDDENYYLIAYDDKAGMVKHYRVDKIRDAVPSEEKRSGREVFENMDLADFSKKTFGMYGGYEEMVSLKLPESLFGVMMDRFGKETDVRVLSDGYVRVRVKAVVSRQFFGWLCGLGKDVTILAPEKVKEDYGNWLKEIWESQKEG